MDMRTEKERWFSYALDLERLRLDERLVRVTPDNPCDDAKALLGHTDARTTKIYLRDKTVPVVYGPRMKGAA